MTDVGDTQYYIVGERPVKFVTLPDGAADLLALDWQTGEFVREWRYLTTVMSGRTSDVESVSEAEFERRVAALREDIRRGSG